jgi:beta-barrel assembly-enhancing protease
MIFRLSLIAVSVSIFLCAGAQDFNNYVPLRSYGAVPPILTMSYPDLVNTDLQALKKKDKALYQKTQYIIYTRLIMSRLVMNGRLLINDSLGVYVNQVADKLLEHDQELRKQLHIFVVKSPAVNAYSLDNGIILINIGLLSQLETEAELAYILSHEIVHFMERHSMQEYVLSQKNKRAFTREYLVYDNLSFSRENELEADSKGLELLIRSNYNINAAVTALDVLKYSYLPFDEVPFDIAFFNSEDLTLPSSYRLQEIKAISDDEDYDDQKSTHPNIKARRETVNNTLRYAKDTSSTRKNYIVVSRERFRRLRMIARFETARLHLAAQNYPEAIYTSYLLQRDYPNSYYLKNIAAKALYNLAVYSTSRQAEEKEYKKEYELPHYDKIEGNIQQVYFLYKNLYPINNTTLALSYCWKLKKENPNDHEMARMCENLFYMLAQHHSCPRDHFKQRHAPDKGNEEISEDLTDTLQKELSKYEMIRRSQKKTIKSKKEENEDPFEYAFASLLANDSSFKALYNKYLDPSDVIPKPDWLSQAAASAMRETKDSLLMIDPIHLRLEYYSPFWNKRNMPRIKFDHKPFDPMQARYREILKKAANQAMFEFSIIDPTDFDSLSIEQYNDVSLLTDWMSENQHHTRPLVVNSCAESLRPLELKYGKYVMWNYTVTTRSRIKNLGAVIACSVFWPVAFLTVPTMLFHRKYEHYYSATVLDLSKGSIVVGQYESASKNFKYRWLQRKMRKTFKELNKNK